MDVSLCSYWSMNYFLQWAKLWNWFFTEDIYEKNLVQYGDGHGFIATYSSGQKVNIL